MQKLGYQTEVRIHERFPYGENKIADIASKRLSQWREGEEWKPDGDLILILDEMIHEGGYLMEPDLLKILEDGTTEARKIMDTIPVPQVGGGMATNPYPGAPA